jgi:hypothetical protein
VEFLSVHKWTGLPSTVPQSWLVMEPGVGPPVHPGAANANIQAASVSEAAIGAIGAKVVSGWFMVLVTQSFVQNGEPSIA